MEGVAGAGGNGIGFGQRLNADFVQHRSVDDGHDVRHGARIIERQRNDARMRVRRAHEDCVQRIARRKIGSETSLRRHEAFVFDPRERSHRRHGSSARSSISTR